MSTEKLLEAFNNQKECWPLAAQNYNRLNEILFRTLPYGDFEFKLQFNPSRVVSTGAKIDSKSIEKRPCFLCNHNRPKEQYVLKNFKEWEVLLNPYPIFKIHFTIAYKGHLHQDVIDFSEMAEFTLKHQGLVTFYNGSASGASCPDHLHFQATLQDELPIIKFTNSNPGNLLMKDKLSEIYIADYFPSPAIHFITEEYNSSIKLWTDTLLPLNDYNIPDKSKRNLIMWKDESGKLHTLFFPRSKHRPECYTADKEDFQAGKFMVSPGAIDMSGLIITPRKEDFESLTAFDVNRILDEVSFDIHTSPSFSNLLIK